MERAGRLIESGDVDSAAALLRSTIHIRLGEPGAALGMLLHLGALVDHDPRLLMLRARARRYNGESDTVLRDIERIAELASDETPEFQRYFAFYRTYFEVNLGATPASDGLEAITDLQRSAAPTEYATRAGCTHMQAEWEAYTETRSGLLRARTLYEQAYTLWQLAGDDQRAGLVEADMVSNVLVPLGRHREALQRIDTLLKDVTAQEQRAWLLILRAFALLSVGEVETSEKGFSLASSVAPGNPLYDTAIFWGLAAVALRRGDRELALQHIRSVETTALGDGDLMSCQFWIEMATGIGAIGDLQNAALYVAHAERHPDNDDLLGAARYILDARHGRVGDVDEILQRSVPAGWWRIHLVTAHAQARNGNIEAAHHHLRAAEQELVMLEVADFDVLGEGSVATELRRILGNLPEPVTTMRLFGPALTIDGPSGAIDLQGERQRALLALIAADDRPCTTEQLVDALWPHHDTRTGRMRLRTLLQRLRQHVPGVLQRQGKIIQLDDDVRCDLHEFRTLATAALATMRRDPDSAVPLAAQAAEIAGDGQLFIEFRTEDWWMPLQAEVHNRLLSLLALLVAHASDAGHHEELGRWTARAAAVRDLAIADTTVGRFEDALCSD